MANIFDDANIDTKGFAYRDMLGLDRWDSFTVSTNVSTAGTTTFTGRYRLIGKACEFQAQLSASGSIATTTGIHYFALPISAKGLAGFAIMTNLSTNAGSACGVNLSTSRVYLPTQASTTAILSIFGKMEIG